MRRSRNFAPRSWAGGFSFEDQACCERLAQGLRQLMAGARKFSLSYVTRDDLVALTREAAQISGIRYVMDVDQEDVEKILAN